MLRPNFRRGGRNGRPVVKDPAPTKAYKVLVGFSHAHVVRTAGEVIQMTDAQAKYDLLAKRITLFVPAPVAAPVAPTVTQAPAAAPAPSKDAGKDDAKPASA